MSPAYFSLHNRVPARLLFGIERKVLSLGFLYYTERFARKRAPSSFQKHMKEFVLGFSRICTSYLSHLGPYSTHLINVSIFMALLSLWKLHCWCMPEGCSEQTSIFLLDWFYIGGYTGTLYVFSQGWLEASHSLPLLKTNRPAWLYYGRILHPRNILTVLQQCHGKQAKFLS